MNTTLLRRLSLVFVLLMATSLLGHAGFALPAAAADAQASAASAAHDDFNDEPESADRQGSLDRRNRLDGARRGGRNHDDGAIVNIGHPGPDAWFGRLLHLIQETPEGCVMRSRFWLGEIDPVPNPKPTHEMLEKLVPDELGAGLFAHCCEEMSILADFLPTVYRIHNADTRRPQGTR